jgi:LysR family transcriptional regulator for metE and metH
VDALLAGEIDLALVTDDVQDVRIRVTRLFRDELVALVAPTHPWAPRGSISLEDLHGQHLIVYNADRATSFLLGRVLGPAGVEPGRVSAVPLTEAIVELAAAGLGIGALARWSVAPAIKARSVVALRIGPRGVYRTWSAVTLRERSEPAWMRDFVLLVKARAMPAKVAADAPRIRRVV